LLYKKLLLLENKLYEKSGPGRTFMQHFFGSVGFMPATFDATLKKLLLNPQATAPSTIDRTLLPYVPITIPG